jgi:hypothetical protein
MQTSRSSSVVRITGIAFGWIGSITDAPEPRRHKHSAAAASCLRGSLMAGRPQ